MDVLESGSKVIQIWADLDMLQNYSKISFTTNYGSDFETESNKVFNFLYHEIYGDNFLMMNLLCKYYMVLSNKRKAQIEILKSKEKKSIILDYSHHNYAYVNSRSEQAFQMAMKKCYSDFCEITLPLLNQQTISELVDLYKFTLTQHYN